MRTRPPTARPARPLPAVRSIVATVGRTYGGSVGRPVAGGGRLEVLAGGYVTFRFRIGSPARPASEDRGRTERTIAHPVNRGAQMGRPRPNPCQILVRPTCGEDRHGSRPVTARSRGSFLPTVR